MENLAEQQKEEAPLEELPSEQSQKLIIVTGYGPFVGHEEVNASWEAVRLLPDAINYKGSQYKLEKLKVEVEYEAVDKVVDEIWNRDPELVIHCGVHGNASSVLLERLAYNHKFNRPDNKHKRLPRNSACLVNCCDDDVIHCGLNVNRIVGYINKSCKSCARVSTEIVGNSVETSERGAHRKAKPVAKTSNDVGGFLCGYIYLKSLDRNRFRTLFVHVPPIDQPFSSPETADILFKVVEECVHQVEENVSKND